MPASPSGNRGRRNQQRNRRRGVRSRGTQRRGQVTSQARQRLRGFRQASFLAIAITAFILLLFPDFGADAAAQDPEAPVPQEEPQVLPDDPPATADELARETTEAFQETVYGLWVGFMAYLPRLIVVLAVVLLAWILARLIRSGLRRLLGGWHRANAVVALSGIAVWLLAIGVAVSVLAGDIRALLGSIGLVGLALSWALQTPIESFTGWLMNSFHGYYRPGDRVAVGDIFGDVYRIDFLTTTVWEIGSPERSGFVRAEQPTGRLITFPNNEVLAGSIVNLTRDFPYVWDELTVPIANESDLPYAKRVLQEIANELLDDYMTDPAHQYQSMLQRTRLESDVPDRPQVFVSLAEYSTDLTIRYLVGARERRAWKTRLSEAITETLNDPAHADRILPVYERHQLQFVRGSGEVVEPDWGASASKSDAAPGTDAATE